MKSHANKIALRTTVIIAGALFSSEDLIYRIMAYKISPQVKLVSLTQDNRNEKKAGN